MAKQLDNTGAYAREVEEIDLQNQEINAPAAIPNVEPGGEKRKKPLLERLGIIELVVPSRPAPEPSAPRVQEPVEPPPRQVIVPDSPVLDSTNGPAPPLTKLSIANIYEKFNLEPETTRNVFLIEKFLKALPANLPSDVRRQTIVDLMQASQLNLTKLIQDGNNRIDILQQFARDFALRADEIIAAQQRQIRKLNDMIAQHNRTIEEHQRMKEAQSADVEYEVQNIANILRSMDTSAR
ncbi:MAG: hypothetical protein BWK76_28380 [Desulfobulbaceae bacterium A2]|nr:MAG: hypothetical protein BWK76_28380 [Desulfobulbaceae bacterium A2]